MPYCRAQSPVKRPCICHGSSNMSCILSFSLCLSRSGSSSLQGRKGKRPAEPFCIWRLYSCKIHWQFRSLIVLNLEEQPALPATAAMPSMLVSSLHVQTPWELLNRILREVTSGHSRSWLYPGLIYMTSCRLTSLLKQSACVVLCS